jgi:hypothetical protein
LIFTDITGTYVAEDDQGSRCDKISKEYGVGGFVIIKSTPYVLLICRLRPEADIPLLSSSDFEIGPGNR